MLHALCIVLVMHHTAIMYRNIFAMRGADFQFVTGGHDRPTTRSLSSRRISNNFHLPYSRNGGKKGGARGLSETAGWTSVMALLGDSGPPHYCTSIHSWCTRRASCVDLIIKKQKKWGIVGTWYLTWARTSYVTQIALATEKLAG